MEYKNISSKFTLQTHTKYKNTKIQTCLHEIFLLSQKIYTGRVSYCQNADIREVAKYCFSTIIIK